MLTTVIFTLCLFATFMAMMGIGFIIRGTVLKGSCGGASQVMGEDSCGACAKKEKEMCPSDDETGLLNMSQMSNPHRTFKEKDSSPGYQV